MPLPSYYIFSSRFLVFTFYYPDPPATPRTGYRPARRRLASDLLNRPVFT